jgi:hypothetical protein
MGAAHTNYTKYPRTLHLPWSEGRSDDDKVLDGVDHFVNKQIVVTEKLDGENTSMYVDHVHARSLDSKHHPSRTWVKRIQSEVGHGIPAGWRLCGENVYAKHSIFYDKLTAYFYIYSIWTDKNLCLSWDETKEWAALLGLETVPVLYEGIWDEAAVKACWTGVSKFGPQQEGYVVRLRDGFAYDDFGQSVAKFVRQNHVQTTSHWMEEEVFPNLIVGGPSRSIQ